MASRWMATAGFSVAVAALAFSAGRQVSTQSQPPGIRYISQQRILTESADAKAELAKLQQLQQQRAASLRALQQELDATRRQLAQSDGQAVAAALQAQEAKQRAELDRATQQAQADVQAFQRQIQGSLQGRLKAVLDDVLRGQDVQIVLNAETSVVWANAGLDLTQTVIDRLNVGRTSPE